MDKNSLNSLSLSEEQAMLLETSREFFRKKWTIGDVRRQLDTVLGYDLNVWNEMVDLGWLGYPLTVIWIVALTNIFNFMDGMDGLAGGVAVIVAVFLCIVTYIEGSFFVYILCYVLAASAAGFLVFNFPRARLFMGDVGSQFLGFSFAALAVIAAEIDASRTSFLVVPLLFFNFIFDTVFTVCRRALRGEKVTQAHRTHLYQLLNRIGWSHVRVSGLHFFMTAAQGVGALMMVEYRPEQEVLLFLPFLAVQSLYAVLIMSAARRHGILAANVGK